MDMTAAADPAQCLASVTLMYLGITAEIAADSGTACPVQPTPTDPDNTLQDTIDEVYSSCDGAAEWEGSKPIIKAAVEAIGCVEGRPRPTLVTLHSRAVRRRAPSQVAPFVLVLATALVLKGE